MTDSAKSLLDEYLHREGGWVIHHSSQTVEIPIKVLDVKLAYGRIRVFCQVAHTNQAIWLDTSSVKLLRKE